METQYEAQLLSYAASRVAVLDEEDHHFGQCILTEALPSLDKYFN